MSTLVMVPSRQAALQFQGWLPHAQLASRTKTGAHLREERDEASLVHVSTWSPAALTFRPY